MAKKLSKEECDALLEVFNGKKNTFKTNLKEDLKNHTVIAAEAKKNPTLAELVPVIQFIHENFCSSLQRKFSFEFKMNTFLKRLSTDIIKFGEYKNTLAKDSLTYIFSAKEIHCSMFIHLENNLSSSFINKSLGATKNYQSSNAHSYSKIDESIISKQIFLIAKELETSFNAAFEKIHLSFTKCENRSQLLALYHPNDELLVSQIEISSESVQGIFHVVFPGIGLKLLKANQQR
jgi:flagellar motor switch protein FliM